MVAIMVLCAAPVSAYEIFTSQTIETTGIVIDEDGNTMDYDVWVYGLTIYADASSSFIGIYNVDTLAELNSATTYPKDELGEPTQFEATTEMYAFPRRFSDGVGAIITVGVGFIHYGPEPE